MMAKLIYNKTRKQRFFNNKTRKIQHGGAVAPAPEKPIEAPEKPIEAPVAPVPAPEKPIEASRGMVMEPKYEKMSPSMEKEFASFLSEYKELMERKEEAGLEKHDMGVIETLIKSGVKTAHKSMKVATYNFLELLNMTLAQVKTEYEFLLRNPDSEQVENVLLLTQAIMKLKEHPEFEERWRMFILDLENYTNPLLEALTRTINRNGDRLARSAYKATNGLVTGIARGATNALETALAAVPGVGAVMSGVRLMQSSIDSLAKITEATLGTAATVTSIMSDVKKAKDSVDPTRLIDNVHGIIDDAFGLKNPKLTEAYTKFVEKLTANKEKAIAEVREGKVSIGNTAATAASAIGNTADKAAATAEAAIGNTADKTAATAEAAIGNTADKAAAAIETPKDLGSQYAEYNSMKKRLNELSEERKKIDAEQNEMMMRLINKPDKQLEQVKAYNEKIKANANEIAELNKKINSLPFLNAAKPAAEAPIDTSKTAEAPIAKPAAEAPIAPIAPVKPTV